MTTEQFSKADFEAALPVDKNTGESLWIELGLDMGEYTYIVPIKNEVVARVAIMIRSSVNASGFAAATGKDSIRLWLVNSETNKPLGKKVDAYTTRVSGWQERMNEKLELLREQALEMCACPKCSSGVILERNGKYGKFYGCSNYPDCKNTMNSLPKQDAMQAKKPKIKAEKEQDNEQALENLLAEIDESTPRPKKPRNIELNDQQKAYVNAPVDANIRVMAGPGSGKTTATIERIVHLIENGVNPNSIVYTTFSKDMADEGYKRILARLPEIANTNFSRQCCTIHAICYRILKWEGYKYNVAKEWQIKKELSEIVEVVWEGIPSKPGWKEVILWIDNAKLNGLTSNEDFEFYQKYMHYSLAAMVHDCRVKFENKFEKMNLLTFADMLFKVECLLKRNKQFREKWQAKFEHVLVDEAQDINGQALRILIALSLEPGQ